MPSKPNPEGRRKAKATRLQKQARLEEILRIRLEGAELWDIREYVSERSKEPDSPWVVNEGLEPLTDSALRAYIAEADKLARSTVNGKRETIIRDHLAKRKALYAKAVTANDYRTALVILKDECELRGLYELELHKEQERQAKKLADLERLLTGKTDDDSRSKDEGAGQEVAGTGGTSARPDEDE